MPLHLNCVWHLPQLVHDLVLPGFNESIPSPVVSDNSWSLLPTSSRTSHLFHRKSSLTAFPLTHLAQPYTLNDSSDEKLNRPPLLEHKIRRGIHTSPSRSINLCSILLSPSSGTQAPSHLPRISSSPRLCQDHHRLILERKRTNLPALL